MKKKKKVIRKGMLGEDIIEGSADASSAGKSWDSNRGRALVVDLSKTTAQGHAPRNAGSRFLDVQATREHYPSGLSSHSGAHTVKDQLADIEEAVDVNDYG